jgi:hypothetical protein
MPLNALARIGNLFDRRETKNGIEKILFLLPKWRRIQKIKAMAMIIKEPFPPKRRLIKTRTHFFEWWRAFLAVVPLFGFKIGMPTLK